MQNRQLFALGLIGAAVFAACVGALVYGLVQDPQVAGPIAGAIGVVAAAVVQRRWEKRQELERLRREQMAPIYEQLTSIVKTKGGEESATAEFFQDFTTKLVLYGPPPIIKSWNTFRALAMPEDMTNPTYLLTYEQLLFLIRKDLGHDDSTLIPGRPAPRVRQRLRRDECALAGEARRGWRRPVERHSGSRPPLASFGSLRRLVSVPPRRRATATQATARRGAAANS